MNAYLAARNLRQGQYTIYAEYSSYPKVKRIATGVKVNQKYWDVKARLVKANGTANVSATNDHLKAVLAGLNATIKALYLENGNILPTVEQLNIRLAATTETIAAIAAEQTLVTQLIGFISHQVETADWAKATEKGFITLVNNVKAYEKASKTTWLLSTLTNRDLELWQQWLLKTYDYNNATLGKRVRLLRQFLREKQPKNINLGKVKPIYKQSLTSPIVLYKSEIEALRKLDLSKNPRLERVRDLQQAQIFSGLRFSDLMALRQHHIKGGFIEMEMIKTGQSVKVPIFPQLQSILDKYTNIETHEIELPEISNQKFNEYLKELCALIPELAKPVVVEIKKRREKIVNKPQKFTLITSHSSRRSFCTLCLDLGFKAKQVMEWSGHRTLAAFQRYMGNSEEQADISQVFAVAYDAK